MHIKLALFLFDFVYSTDVFSIRMSWPLKVQHTDYYAAKIATIA
jgi:hypothetical protein